MERIEVLSSLEQTRTVSAADPVSAPTPASRHAKIEVRGLRKVFTRKSDTLVVLEAIYLTVQRGEFVCLLGPSGCGKSTFLNIVGGFETPTAGSVTVDGEAVRGPDPRRAFVFQEHGIFPWASVWDNIGLGLRRRAGGERARTIQHFVQLVGLTGFEKSYPGELSGGMRQRVALARALAVSPDVLFMDEPLGALDFLTRLSIRAEILRIWCRERPTIVLVTHDVDEALQLAERVVVLSPRPCRVVDVEGIGMPYPRDFGSPEYGRARNKLLDLLGVR